MLGDKLFLVRFLGNYASMALSRTWSLDPPWVWYSVCFDVFAGLAGPFPVQCCNLLNRLFRLLLIFTKQIHQKCSETLTRSTRRSNMQVLQQLGLCAVLYSLPIGPQNLQHQRCSEKRPAIALKVQSYFRPLFCDLLTLIYITPRPRHSRDFQHDLAFISRFPSLPLPLDSLWLITLYACSTPAALPLLEYARHSVTQYFCPEWTAGRCRSSVCS